VAAVPRRRSRTGSGFQARRLAMIVLFEDEFRPDQANAALERLAVEKNASAPVREHAGRIVDGVLEHRAELDSEIARHAPAIPVSELGIVERTILRSAIYEVLYSAATPSGETIHDAVSLARTYAGDAARRLVNGVLGSVSRPSGSERGARDG
jgi:transcription antitermination protein NusB